MQKSYKLSSETSGLGDILLLTAVTKNLLSQSMPPSVSLPRQIERFSILFDGLADVTIEETKNYLSDIGSGHYATRKLRNFFSNAELLDNRPLVIHSNIESESWANNYLFDKKNPVIFVPNCSKHWHEIRSLKTDKAQLLIDKLINDGFTPIICQNSNNPTSIKNLHILTDLDLSKYISLLRKTGIYVGCNTGDMHLAIAVGASCSVFQPKNNSLFNEDDWNYKHPSIIYSPL